MGLDTAAALALALLVDMFDSPRVAVRKLRTARDSRNGRRRIDAPVGARLGRYHDAGGCHA
jgi:hypothetical protein